MPLLLHWTLFFCFLALVSGALGYTGVAAVSANIAGVLLLCLIAFAIITAVVMPMQRVHPRGAR